MFSFYVREFGLRAEFEFLGLYRSMFVNSCLDLFTWNFSTEKNGNNGSVFPTNW